MKVVIIGSGSIGSGIIPMLFREMPNLQPHDMCVISPSHAEVAELHKIRHIEEGLTPENYLRVLNPLVSASTLVLNLSVDVSSKDVLMFCRARDAHYVDTCIEPWAGGYSKEGGGCVTNSSLRHSLMTATQSLWTSATSIVACGANPGLVSCFTKQALLNLIEDETLKVPKAVIMEGLGAVAQFLGIRSIQIAERDTQVLGRPVTDHEFANTWSVDGFCSEGEQYAELSYGSHESYSSLKLYSHIPNNHMAVLPKRGFEQKVLSFTPTAGSDWAYLISHHEAGSIADMLTVPGYRPTVYYAYRPTDAAVTSIKHHVARGYTKPEVKTIFQGNSGYDELGVLLIADNFTYWYGSTLNTAQARALMPYNGPTTLQVTATIAAAVRHIIANPGRGVIEAEQLPFLTVLEQSGKYLGHVAGYEVEWNPGTKIENFLI